MTMVNDQTYNRITEIYPFKPITNQVEPSPLYVIAQNGNLGQRFNIAHVPIVATVIAGSISGNPDITESRNKTDNRKNEC